ncbi:ATP-binding cassette domain-containing protein [Microvirga sp. W0021]|uniref:ATP-binding cassette domain-containing protein n=1 Tax=Hohaiivirga grylli TaxID=3133970 RepID=A0ABV0BGB5_9HYPH
MIEVQNLSITFNPGTPNERRALKDISLRLENGEFACIIGSNGAGKSTLLGSIAGDVPLSGGRIMVSNTDVTKLPAEQRATYIARVFQDPLLGSCGDLSIAENLALASARGRRRTFRRALNRHYIETVKGRISELGLGLEDNLSQPMGSLSGGQRQALSLVMATLSPSSVLLLDEHTAALDPRNAEFVLDLTKRFAERYGLTVLMVTHSMRQALDMGTRTIMLHEGNIIFDASGSHRKDLTIEDLLAQFRRVRNEDISEDRLLVG